MDPADAKYGTPVQHPEHGRGIVVWKALGSSVLLHGSTGTMIEGCRSAHGGFVHVIADDLPLDIGPDYPAIPATRWSEWEPWDGPDEEG